MGSVEGMLGLARSSPLSWQGIGYKGAYEVSALGTLQANDLPGVVARVE